MSFKKFPFSPSYLKRMRQRLRNASLQLALSLNCLNLAAPSRSTDPISIAACRSEGIKVNAKSRGRFSILKVIQAFFVRLSRIKFIVCAHSKSSFVLNTDTCFCQLLVVQFLMFLSVEFGSHWKRNPLCSSEKALLPVIVE